MPPLPDVTLSFKDGALGIVAENTSKQALKLGVSPMGLLNTIYSATKPDTLQQLLGKGGPLVEAAAHSLSIAGGPILCVPVNPSTYGTVSSVVKVGLGAETLVATAQPIQAIRIKATVAGTASTAKFQISFDGGVTYNGTDIVTAATLMLPGFSFLTLAFGAGSAVVGDLWDISTAGVITPTMTGTLAVTISSVSPPDAYSAIVTIVAGGALGTATFNYSLDAGRTVSGTIVVPSSGIYVLPDAGVKLVFTGTSTAGDYFTFTTTAPSYSSSDLTTALTAVFADPRKWFLVHVIGAPSSVANTASLVATVDAQMVTAQSAFRFAGAVLECFNDTDANIIAGLAATASALVGVGAGNVNLTSSLNGRIQPRNVAWVATARLAKNNPGVDASKVADGPLIGVVSLVRDEQATPGLDGARLITARSIIGRQGFYLTNARLIAAVGSDFQFFVARRVMDVFAAAVRDALLTYLNDSVRVSATDGTIVEKDAQAIEAFVGGQARAVVTQPGDASDVSIAVTRNNNIVSTGQLRVTARCVPLGYARAITVDIGFSNPALKLT